MTVPTLWAIDNHDLHVRGGTWPVVATTAVQLTAARFPWPPLNTVGVPTGAPNTVTGNRFPVGAGNAVCELRVDGSVWVTSQADAGGATLDLGATGKPRILTADEGPFEGKVADYQWAEVSEGDLEAYIAELVA
jgi:hypothetical protein